MKRSANRLLSVLAVFAVSFNVALVFNYYLKQYTDYHTIKEHATAPPKVRETGYPLQKGQIERNKALTVLISNEDFGSVSRGTGILIDSVHVLTCAHLIDSWDDDLWIFLNDGTFVKGRPAVADKSVDLAIIDLSRPVRVPSVAVFAKTVHDGEPITVIGNALGSMKWFVSYGFVSGTYKQWVLTDGNVFHGDSGGPWINEAGEIVGISAWGLERNGRDLGVHGGISPDAVKKFLENWKKPKLDFSIILGG